VKELENWYKAWSTMKSVFQFVLPRSFARLTCLFPIGVVPSRRSVPEGAALGGNGARRSAAKSERAPARAQGQKGSSNPFESSN